MHCTPVKLHTRSNAVTAGAEHQNLFPPVNLNIRSVCTICEVKIVGFGGILCGKGIDLRQMRSDSEPMSKFSYLDFLTIQSLGDKAIRVSSTFSLTDATRDVGRKLLAG